MNKKISIIFAVSITVAFSIGFFAGMEYKSYQIAKALSSAFSQPSTIKTTDTITPTPTENPSSVTEKKIGDEVELATLKIKVNKVSEAQNVTEYGEPKVAQEGTRFILVNITATNLTNSAFAFPSDLPLVDDKGRIYKTDPTKYGTEDSIVYRNMSPGIAETGTIVYQLPNDSTSYSLQAYKGDSNNLYKIVLK